MKQSFGQVQKTVKDSSCDQKKKKREKEKKDLGERTRRETKAEASRAVGAACGGTHLCGHLQLVGC